MKHAHVIDGPAFRLRPVTMDDAATIVELRRAPAQAGWLHAGAPDATAQQRWLVDYEASQGDYYFVVESRASGATEGLVAVYEVDEAARSAEWGRWVLRPGSLAAVESAWLVYRFAFEVLGLASLYCRTVDDNRAVVSFHDSCGITDRRVLRDAVLLHGRRHDFVQHTLHEADSGEPLARLGRLAHAMARRLQRAHA